MTSQVLFMQWIQHITLPALKAVLIISNGKYGFVQVFSAPESGAFYRFLLKLQIRPGPEAPLFGGGGSAPERTEARSQSHIVPGGKI